MKKSLEQRLKLLEQRLAELEAKKKPKTKVIRAKIDREEQMLMNVGLASMAFHISDRIRRDPTITEFDGILQKLFGQEMNPEARYACSSKMWERGLAVLEETKNKYIGKKALKE